MSVAEKPITETAVRSTSSSLALHSLAGGILLLFSLWFVLAGLPLLWSEVLGLGESAAGRLGLVNPFLSGALLLMVTLAVIAGIGYLGLRLEKAYYQRGLREGTFVAAILLYILARIVIGIGNIMYGRDFGTAGLGITIGLGALLLFLLYKWFSMPGFAAWLGGLQDSGWFETTGFKSNQGVRIRRITVIALLLLGFWGIISLINQRALGWERPGGPSNDWLLSIPFTGDSPDDPNTLPLMFHVHLVMPVVLGIILVWLAWRIVNLPTFADFLIATEAEMNKVSWTTRRRLFQDTIVVLTTVILMTTFLFVVDILWIKILSSDWIYVLQVDTREAREKLQEKAQW